MAIRINELIRVNATCIGDIEENGTTWVDELGNLGILVEDEPYLFHLDQLQKYADTYDSYLSLGVTLVDIEITVKEKEN